MTAYHYYLYYLLPLLLVALLYVRSRLRHNTFAKATLKDAIESGLTEPATLHPHFEIGRCFGSGACVKACPEEAIGIIDGKAVLVNPAVCIGHGACETACPNKAIRLVFGTEKRGMEIPLVNPDFQTNVPGIFIAGELGGMGLIRKSVEQGRQAIDNIAKVARAGMEHDVVIVGAGPAGISASLAAKKLGLNYVTVDQEDSLGGTTYHYPRNKIVMTAPMDLPLIGKIKVREITKEALMELWQSVFDRADLAIRYNEKMEAIVPVEGGYEVTTSKASYRTSTVLLSIGRRGTPRRLGVPGEDQPKVVYRLIEAEQYRGMHVLVIGGGDSALEAALDVAEETGAVVTLSYRGSAFNRVKVKNLNRLDAALEEERLAVMLDSQVLEIFPEEVVLRTGSGDLRLRNDIVIVCAGGELPTPFLKKIGVMVEARFGT